MKILWQTTFTLLFTSATKAFIPSSSSPCRQIVAKSSSLNMASSTNLTQAKQRISQAISTGAPAYNAGDIEKCATVYEDAATEIVSLLPPKFATKLLSEVENENHDSFDAKAWALRKVFDSIIDYQLPLVPQDDVSNISFEQFTNTQLGDTPLGVMDNVMGGISQGSWISKTKTFFGETSLANNGGFASLRWRFPTTQNWSYAKGIYIKGLKHSKPEEHTFNIILKDSMCERARLANFKAVFANPELNQTGDQTLLIPFSVFNQMEQMGRAMVGSPAFSPMQVTEIGIMAIKPTVVGEFQLEFEDWGLYT